MKIRSIILMLFLLGIQAYAYSQEQSYNDLAYGEWIYDGDSKEFFGKILLMDDGTFEWITKKTGSEEHISKGTYEVTDRLLIMTYEGSGQKVWNYEIETLNHDKLVFRWVENVFRYRRANS